MNSFFSEDEQDPHYNACVGENTAGDNSYGYKWGFEQAVYILSSAAIQGEFHDPTVNQEESQEYACLDAIIYPVCFCARHFIELFIKHHTKKVMSLIKDKSEKLKPIENSVHNSRVHGHNLIHLFDNLKILSNALDSRLSNALDPICEFINEFSKIDPTGEVFRYHINQDDELHLSDIPRISILNFYDKFKKLKKHTDEFDLLMEFIIEEYRQGTFTKNLSRDDIRNLSKFLPPISEWHDKAKIKAIKSEFAKDYGVSTREVNEAIKLIKNNMEFSNNINSEIIIDSIRLSSISLITSLDDNWRSLTEIADCEWQSLNSILDCGVGITYCESYSRHFESSKETYIDKNYIGRHISLTRTRFLSGLRNLHQKTILSHYLKCIEH